MSSFVNAVVSANKCSLTQLLHFLQCSEGGSLWLQAGSGHGKSSLLQYAFQKTKDSSKRCIYIDWKSSIDKTHPLNITNLLACATTAIIVFQHLCLCTIDQLHEILRYLRSPPCLTQNLKLIFMINTDAPFDSSRSFLLSSIRKLSSVKVTCQQLVPALQLKWLQHMLHPVSKALGELPEVMEIPKVTVSLIHQPPVKEADIQLPLVTPLPLIIPEYCKIREHQNCYYYYTSPYKRFRANTESLGSASQHKEEKQTLQELIHDNITNDLRQLKLSLQRVYLLPPSSQRLRRNLALSAATSVDKPRSARRALQLLSKNNQRLASTQIQSLFENHQQTWMPDLLFSCAFPERLEDCIQANRFLHTCETLTAFMRWNPDEDIRKYTNTGLALMNCFGILQKQSSKNKNQAVNTYQSWKPAYEYQQQQQQQRHDAIITRSFKSVHSSRQKRDLDHLLMSF